MPALNKLSSARIKSAPPGKYNDGGGLWLFKRDNGLPGSWIFRFTVNGTRREMSLGSAQVVKLQRARELAADAREAVADGFDPLEKRQAQKRQSAPEKHLLKDIAVAAFEAKKAELKDDGKAGRWFSPLELHVLPKLGKYSVIDITQRDIAETLNPIWHSKAATAQKAVNRLGICLKYAAALGLSVDLQVTAKAKSLLGKQRHSTVHTPALDWRDVPEFYQSLSEPSVTHLALQFLILTAVRSKGLRKMTFDEVSGHVWTIPGDRMKGGKEHRVPLCDEALAILDAIKPLSTDRAVFPGVRGDPISDATMSRYMERRGMKERPHGFRTSFRTWCAEETDVPREIAETALAHTSGGKVELAYRRTDYLDKRRDLMAQWARHVTSAPG